MHRNFCVAGEILARPGVFIYNYGMESILKFRPLSIILALLGIAGVVFAAYFILPNVRQPGGPEAFPDSSQHYLNPYVFIWYHQGRTYLPQITC